MILEIILICIAFGVGFEVGRASIKSQLSAIKAEVVKVEGSAIGEVRSLAAAVKAKL
jgi:hypothetical protein